MSNKENTKFTKSKNAGIAGLWLIEVAFRSLAGYILVSSFNNYFVQAAGVYGLLTAGLIVVKHFVKANG